MLKHAGRRRFMITKNLIMMLVLLAVILLAVFAWLRVFDDVKASGMTVTAKSADFVELAVPEKVNGVDSFPLSNDSWDSIIDFKTSGYLKDLVKDITSNGKQFVLPNFEAANGLEEGRKVIIDDVWTEGLSSKEALTNDKVNDDDQYNYVSLDFYIRSKTKDINVTGESFLAAGSELGIDESNAQSNAKPLKGSNIYRTSTYGASSGTANAFSADAMVGAVRVSLVGAPVDGVTTNSTTGVTTETTYNGIADWDMASALKFLWLPRPDVYLKTNDNSNEWRLYTGIKVSGNSAQGSLSASQVNALAEQTYCHSFYHGETVTGTTVKKGLTAGKYCDTLVKSIDGATSPSTFIVSKTNDDSELGNIGHYPTLGQSKKVASGALESAKNITFTAGSDPNDMRTTDGYYIYKYNLNIWIEGEDAEARRSMNSGVFSLELDFGT